MMFHHLNFILQDDPNLHQLLEHDYMIQYTCFLSSNQLLNQKKFLEEKTTTKQIYNTCDIFSYPTSYDTSFYSHLFPELLIVKFKI